MQIEKKYPRLIADIGGTNARFAIETNQYIYEHVTILACKDYSNVSQAIKAYLELIAYKDKIIGAALALPSPEIGDTFFMVNSPWSSLSIRQTAEDLGLENLIFINDWHALALSIPHIASDKLKQVGGIGSAVKSKPIAVLGPGTGLGMATLIQNPTDNSYLAIPAEGGRSSFPPVNEEEIELWKFVHKRFSHVSAERFLSGPGLQLIYEGLNSINKRIINTLPTPEEIVNAALKGQEWFCIQTVDIFCRMLGTVASNLAVTVNAFGGVYIGGGIIPKMLDYFIHSEFRSRFEDKGRYRPYLVQIPVFVILEEFPAFLGASYALDVYLSKHFIP